MRKIFLGLAVGGLAVVTAAPAAGADRNIAVYELNERQGAVTMVDSSGNGHHGDIGDEVVTGVSFSDGSLGYRFARLQPNTPPAHPEHNVVVPHSEALNPGVGDYFVEVRYRTTHSFGNLIQKGQSATRGGYWKIQLPQGEPSCLFRDTAGNTNAVRSPTRIDDGAWHTVRCQHTAGSLGKVELFVDGAFIGRNRGSIGSISNTQPLSFGGKNDCDQITTTCDYFGGDVDSVRIGRPGATENQAPRAVVLAPACTELSCTFDGSGSSDADGTLVSHVWDFGDGTARQTGARVEHTFPTAGTYRVTLTVTDDQGSQASTTRDVTVPTVTASPVAFRAQSSTTGSLLRPGVTTPLRVEPGDTMLLYLSVNRTTSIAPLDGWTVVGSRSGAAGEPMTQVWRRTADETDAGKQVRVALGAQSKFDLTLAAYSGVEPAAPVVEARSAPEVTYRVDHTTPAVGELSGGDVLLSYWTDKTSASTDWTAPTGPVQRAEVIGTGSGRVNALLTESRSGSGSLTAVSGAASKKAVTWSIVLNAG